MPTMSASVLAHQVGGGTLPAPPWLLSYIGAFALLLTVLALRSSWPAPRLGRFADDAAPGTADDGGREPTRPAVGQLVGIALLGLVLAAAIIGPDDPAANVAPVAVLVVWWVGLPLVALLVGDVMRVVNPFVGIVAALRRGRPAPTSQPPAWLPAAFLGAFGWFFLAYHRPGSPRALAVLLVLYSLAAVGAGLRFGAAWLRTGEGFGALSAAVGRLSPRGARRSVPGLVPLAVVWVGGTLFDGLASTPFWVDVLGTSRGWGRTGFNTLGLVWMTAVAAGVVLGALRIVDREQATASDADGGAPNPAGTVRLVGWALVPLAAGWFVAHDLTLLLFEGQNFLALLSDPFGEGWDLFGTINRTIDYGLVEGAWVGWLQLLTLAGGHLAAVVIAHDVAIRRRGRRRGMAVTWAMAVVATASFVAGVLLVLG